MRVLLISDVYFPRINGVSTSIQTILRALDKKDEACLIAPDYGVPWDDEAHHVIRVPSYPTPGSHEDRVMYGKEIQKLLPQLRKEFFDVVHIHTFGIAFYEGVKIARKLNVPVISTYHTHFEEYLPHYISFWPFWLSRFLSRKLAVWQCNTLDAVVVPSQAMTETLRQNGVTAPMHVVPTGLDLSRFRKGDGFHFREKHAIGSDRQVLLFVGRVAPEKNVEFLIRMLSKVVLHFPEILLVIAGDGQAMNRCRELTCFLGLSSNVLFVGWLDRDTELLDCYDASNIFAFASRTETQGLALLEAMVMGVPVVSISHLGSADTLKAQRGAIVAPDDEAQFAAQVCNLLTDRSRCVVLGSEGRVFAAICDTRAMVGRLKKVYQQVQVSKESFMRFVKRWISEVLVLLLLVFYVLLEDLKGVN